MSKVYVVTRGSYSDYRIIAVFSTQQAARACRDLIAGPDDRFASGRLAPQLRRLVHEDGVEEYELDTAPETWPGSWCVEVDKGGNVVDGPYWYEAPASDPAFTVQGRLWIGYGKTPEHARRSADQKRREDLALPFLAEGAGG